MVSRWTQELLSYHFSVLNRPARIMADADALTHRFDNLTAQYIKITALLSHYDRSRLPEAEAGDLKSVPRATRIPATDHAPTVDIPILTVTIINGTIDTTTTSQSCQYFSTTENFQPSLSPFLIMLHSSTGRYRLTPTVEPPTNTSGKMKKETLFQVFNWLCIDDVTGSFTSWSISGNYGAINWQFNNIYIRQSTTALLPILFPERPISKLSTLRE